MSNEPKPVDPLARGADEMIWGIPRSIVLRGGAWRGFRRFASLDEGMAEIARLEKAAQVRPRRELEMDPEWKQPIPYAIAIFRDAAGDAHLFWMDRLAGTSDRRLHGRASFGVGGHIGAEDSGIMAALTREWSEEVETPTLPTFTPLGLLNDDGDDVGRVHIGVVFLARMSSPDIQVRERQKLAGSLVPIKDAVMRADELEGWSAALISHLEELAT